MLTPRLSNIRDALRNKGYSKRSKTEDELLEELDDIDRIPFHSLTENIRAKSSTSMMGTTPGDCPTCGRAW